MAITFYYGSGSPFAWKVWLVLEHKGLTYDFKRLQFDKTELKSDAFLAINPRGKVPALVDGDLALYESAAIVEYLEERYPEPTILGTDLETRARTRRIAVEAEAYLQPLQRELFTHTLFKSASDARDLEAIARCHNALLAELAHFERALGEGRYFGGLTPSLADFAVFPVLRGVRRVDDREPANGLGDAMPAWVRAYLARMESLAMVQKTWPPHWR
ncbi:MAG: glutathione S-transferase family protein [Deltaproteobacteria bacterium]|nr:glutathione S-transferase family protein [Deltaproteobacteria bacterium]